MTEEEAKTKWCPLARDSETAGNRLRFGVPADAPDSQYGAEAAAEFPCIASACMAWRWKLSQTNEEHFPGMWPVPEPIYERTEHGFCGLAGSAQ